MTIAEKTTSARNDYVGNGTRTEFPFTFEVLNEANSSTGKNYTLKVLVDDVEKTEDTDYTIGYDSATRLGSITFTTAPASSAVITLLSDISLTQSTDYINIGTGPFPADSHEGTVDKLTLIARELDEKIDRSILLPESSTLSNVTIPVSAANAGKFITVNGDGDDLTASEISETGSAVSTYMKTLLDDETAAEARATLEAQEDVITTRGDIIRGSSTGVAERLALGSSNQILVSNGTDIAYSNNQATTTSLGRLYISNPITISNNVDDADHDIDFTAGNFDFDDGSGQATLNSLTKQIDGAWAEGDNAGGLDTGSVAIDTWYHCYTIYNPTTGVSDALFTATYGSPAMPSGYTKKKWRMAVLTDGSANIVPFKQDGKTINYTTSRQQYSATSGIPTTATDQTVETPLGIRVKANFDATVNKASIVTLNFKDKVTGQAYTGCQSSSGFDTNRVPVYTDTSSTVQHYSNTSTASNYAFGIISWEIPDELF